MSAPQDVLGGSHLSTFVEWAKTHIRGDERGEAQIFLDHFFEALGHKGGCKATGGQLEERVSRGKGVHVGFADFVWKPVVLIEMKRRGADLARHYRQAFDYWVRLVPDRPRYVILCNFDEFWVYDFETQLDAPVDRVRLSELPKRYGPLAFLLPEPVTPVFANDHEAVTREAADLLAECFRSIALRTQDRELSQRFILQMLVALFAEDIDLLERDFVTRLLDECERPADSFDLIGNLFVEMNTPGRTQGGRYRGVDYFNGGLFRVPARIELSIGEIDLLRNAARKDWSMVRPEIFGTLFEHSLEATERHAYGAHFTNAVDIMKIVTPTIVEPWTARIDGADTQAKLHALLERLQRFTVLDPACGSGNFLYLAYREIKRLEARILERIGELSGRDRSQQKRFGFVTARNFFGLDINPFAIELAKVTMSIARKLAIDELHVSEEPLPLDNLDANFRVGDALLTDTGERAPWPRTDVIIGNPPFLGAKRLKPERGVDYISRLRAAYPEVPGMADYCVYWLRRAEDALPVCIPEDPCAGRAGLVGTQNIRNNQSRVGGLDYILQTGTVVEAVDNQPWSGEANVHVSIVNWAKTQDAKLLPRERRLWVKAPTGTTRISHRRGRIPAHKLVELDCRKVPFINSALSDATDVSTAHVLECNVKPQRVFQGITPGHAGFVLTSDEREHLLRLDAASAAVIHPYLIGRELVTGDGTPERYVIDFGKRTLLECQAFPGAFERVESAVLPDRREKYEKGKDKDGKPRSHHKQFLEYWWRLSWGRADMLDAFRGLHGRFIACSRVTKRPIFVFVDTAIRPADALQTFAFDDDYSFGVLQSSIHWQWFIAKCAKLNERPTYNPSSVFDTFPWPQAPKPEHVRAVAEAGRHIRRLRERALEDVRGGGLREVYRVLEAPGKDPLKQAHAALDEAVRDAYGFGKKDSLAAVLALNREMLTRLGAMQPVTPPGIPACYPAQEELVSQDRIALQP